MVMRVSEPGVSLSRRHVKVSERSEKGVGRTSHPKWRCHGKGTDEACLCVTPGPRGSPCLGPGEGERALSRDLVSAVFLGVGGECALCRLSLSGQQSQGDRTDAGPPALQRVVALTHALLLVGGPHAASR